MARRREQPRAFGFGLNLDHTSRNGAAAGNLPAQSHKRDEDSGIGHLLPVPSVISKLVVHMLLISGVGHPVIRSAHTRDGETHCNHGIASESQDVSSFSGQQLLLFTSYPLHFYFQSKEKCSRDSARRSILEKSRHQVCLLISGVYAVEAFAECGVQICNLELNTGSSST
ncbi:hypothetical protein BDV37DRAFT_79216 [Aspergillus pseudonomiae]|uniref:Uncharacterized protein n=1 Tax=Aspergillus pseudonomiae TaxID=1506151 RepID=A0A5N7DU67_9EURO|nr:uncharacterized protein BDV37DRAFT_79216 [Aspergillus pseudonomiae]KAE8409559.1 hypothetical protein BDV37DRAFT_79216 [Aspergillus pseudonomiae]